MKNPSLAPLPQLSTTLKLQSEQLHAFFGYTCHHQAPRRTSRDGGRVPRSRHRLLDSPRTLPPAMDGLDIPPVTKAYLVCVHSALPPHLRARADLLSPLLLVLVSTSGPAAGQWGQASPSCVLLSPSPLSYIADTAPARTQQCGFVTPLQLYFTWRTAVDHGQLWRLVTCFLYWGPLGLDFFFHLFFLCVCLVLLRRRAGLGAREGADSVPSSPLQHALLQDARRVGVPRAQGRLHVASHRQLHPPPRASRLHHCVPSRPFAV